MLNEIRGRRGLGLIKKNYTAESILGELNATIIFFIISLWHEGKFVINRVFVVF